MNIIQFWIVDTIVKVGPNATAAANNKTQQRQSENTNQSQSTPDRDQTDDEHSPLLPK